MRILIIEDDSKVAGAVSAGLAAEGYETRSAATFFLASREHYDLILLDLMLPGRSGFEILETLRQRGIHTPVLVLTARDAVQDRVRGSTSAPMTTSSSRSPFRSSSPECARCSDADARKMPCG